MKRSILPLALAMAALASTLQAATPSNTVAGGAPPALPSGQPPLDVPSGMASLFALPAGAKCPGGSMLYRGPEAKLAARDKMIYCLIARKEIVVVHKSASMSACPPMMKTYASPDATLTPDADVIWCRVPLPGEAVVPPIPPSSMPITN